MSKITLFYDTISPYSLLAFELLMRYESTWGVPVDLKPVFLGGIMNAAKNTPPGMNPRKGKQLLKDFRLMSKLSEVESLPFMSNLFEAAGKMELQRLLALVAAEHAGNKKLVQQSVAAAFALRWKDASLRDGKNKLHVAPAHLRAMCEKLGLDATATLAEANSQRAKDALTANTKEALDHGAFGAPWIVVEHGGKTYTFFGSDRMEAIAFVLGKKYQGPVPAARL
ncbi:Glutathione s-transferase kappa 2 [Diplonema papillatum]|nr:Glutathione s-transferase kappa 2 [Diplonema papillatum]